MYHYKKRCIFATCSKSKPVIFTKMNNRTIYTFFTFLTLLMSVGCSTDFTERLKIPDSHGNRLVVRGAVYDMNSNPLEGIKLELSSYLKDYEVRKQPMVVKNMYSNPDGSFEFNWDNFSTRYVYLLVASDIDGKNNGGDFLSDKIEIRPLKNSPSYDSEHHIYISEGNIFTLEEK